MGTTQAKEPNKLILPYISNIIDGNYRVLHKCKIEIQEKTLTLIDQNQKYSLKCVFEYNKEKYAITRTDDIFSLKLRDRLSRDIFQIYALQSSPNS